LQSIDVICGVYDVAVVIVITMKTTKTTAKDCILDRILQFCRVHRGNMSSLLIKAAAKRIFGERTPRHVWHKITSVKHIATQNMPLHM
jgi:hypothetical protein